MTGGRPPLLDTATKVAVIGAGSLRCSPTILGAVFSRPWPQGSRLHLCDVHGEALDLFSRMATLYAAESNSGLEIWSGSSLESALEGADFIVLCFGLGPLQARFESVLERFGILPQAEEADKIRAVLLNPLFERVNDLLSGLHDPIVVNMVRPTRLTSQLLAATAVDIDAPETLDSASRVTAAHYALRVVQGDLYASLELKKHEAMPLAEFLRGTRGGGALRFDAKALSSWLAELERGHSGISDALLRDEPY